jgi:hypothetical protein
MNNNNLLEIKSLLQKIDYMEIKLNEINKENKKKITIYKDNLEQINELYHNLCKKMYTH